MKLIYKALAVAASMFALSSCVEEAIEPLTGQHQEPGLYTMTQLLSQETSEVAGNKLFIVEVASEGVTGKEGAYKGTGNALVLKFVGEGYKLGSNTYTAPSNDEVQPGTYLVGRESGSGRRSLLKYCHSKRPNAELLLPSLGTWYKTGK